MGEERGEEIGKDIKQFTCCSYCTRKRSCDLLLLRDFTNTTAFH